MSGGVSFSSEEPMSGSAMRAWIAAAAISLSGAPSLCAQSAACTYDVCALSIVPRLSGLDVVRGAREERVGTLSFLLPRAVNAPFVGSDAAQDHARRALSTRRVAAVLTDIGGAAALVGAIHASTAPRDRRWSVYVSLGGAALIGASVLPQFAADAELSRAVREYNRQFAK
jgi:hypothetical protein